MAEQAFAFSLPGYRALLESMLGRGYEAVAFSVAEPSRRHLVLRHDLDMSLQAALPVAEVEAALGVAATYFVLLRTEFYNLHTPRAKAALAKLRLLGHAIGLHFDASLYKEDELHALDTAAAAECAALEEIVGAPVEMISFHRPAPGLVGLDCTLAGRDHAYRPRYVMAMGYCSDSRGAWHHGHPLDHPALAEGRALQLLTHPVWWTGQGDEDPVAKLNRFLQTRHALLQQELAANCEPYRRYLATPAARTNQAPPSVVPVAPLNLPSVTILGDSRAFDTYYLNASYGESGYGYDRTFPFLLRRALLTDTPAIADAVHIPDHFRGGTIENNIIRLALTDPAVVVLLDGLWESLLTKDQFLAYLADKVRDHDWRNGRVLDLSFSSRRVCELFTAGAFPASPERYASRQRRLISYFRRRRRQCIWLTLPIPPRDHFGGLHFAGDYMTIPEWGACLAAINAELAPVVKDYDALLLDLDQLMARHGGPGECLIDQWHFTPRFHAAIADALETMIKQLEPLELSIDHVSRRFLFAREAGDTAVSLCGSSEACAAWAAKHPDVGVDVCFRPGDDRRDAAPLIVVLEADVDQREAVAVSLLRAAPQESIVVYPEELRPLVNPVGDERARYGRLG
ncbi:MAG: hypothetical protein IPM60_00835 [Rhodospirillales bacterium]|nr:hypothetical protein [Rhodospirillales bacterium]